MSTIFDIPSVWRNDLLPASYRTQQFFCESNSLDAGRHIVTHEFPKRDFPYSEDMGRRPYEFTIRGYCIVYPFDADPLHQRDYRVPRDALRKVLDDGQPGILQLPTLRPIYVCCTKYRLTEEEKFGGYCIFDISFIEYGYKPGASGTDSGFLLGSASATVKSQISRLLGTEPTTPLSRR